MTNDRGLGAGDAAGSVPTARPILRERNVVVIPAAGGTERELGTLHGISMGSNMRVPNRGLGWMADSRALIDLPLGADGSPVPYLSSTRQDAAPVISPDGGQVALTSGRSGWPEVWVCRSDQSGCHQVSHMNGSMTGFTSWSPDGRWIAFSSNGPSKGGIYIVRPDGSGLREVAAHPAENIAPCWSADGASIYFSSNRSGRYQIWRVAATGGEAEAITDHGHRPLASRDGRWLFYAGEYAEQSRLLRLDLRTRQEFDDLGCFRQRRAKRESTTWGRTDASFVTGNLESPCRARNSNCHSRWAWVSRWRRTKATSFTAGGNRSIAT